jgi:UDP-hydrolysing UDP-N-acetyl-D-glucosamine 2-epimerase
LNKPLRKVAVLLVDRANYGRLKPVMRAIAEHPALQLQVLCAGTMLLERFGHPVRVVEQDGFTIDGRIHMELEDILLVIGDRYEALAATIAAAYQNIPVAHVQGGEVSGSIDESARHAMTKFAQFHFPATARSAEYLVRMGERPDTVFNVGCPSGDVARAVDVTRLPNLTAGVGAEIDPALPYFLVVFHPVTTEYGMETAEVAALLDALSELAHPTVWLWPNIDAGADHISHTLRRYRERHGDRWIRFIKNFDPEAYLRTLGRAACAIGNSSSFVRDSSFFGTPVVLAGDRQQGREHGSNVVHAPLDKAALLDTIRRQVAHGPYAPETLYGDGHTAARIADRLAQVPLYIQKRLAFESVLA